MRMKARQWSPAARYSGDFKTAPQPEFIQEQWLRITRQVISTVVRDLRLAFTALDLFLTPWRLIEHLADALATLCDY